MRKGQTNNNGVILVFLIINSLSIINGFSQTQTVDQGEILLVAEQMPEFPGGMLDMIEFINKNLTYPVEASKEKISGKVLIQFVVNKEGDLYDFKITKSVGYGCDEEATRVVKMMPKWIPGMNNNVPVSVRMALSISFKY